MQCVKSAISQTLPLMCPGDFFFYFHISWWKNKTVSGQYELTFFFISRLIKEMKRGSPIMQQSLARVLSVINYSKHPSTLPQAIAYLLDGMKSKVSGP